MQGNNIVSAVFDNQSEAERAAADLRAAGVQDRSISVIARNEGGRATTTDGAGDDAVPVLPRGHLQPLTVHLHHIFISCVPSVCQLRRTPPFTPYLSNIKDNKTPTGTHYMDSGELSRTAALTLLIDRS